MAKAARKLSGVLDHFDEPNINPIQGQDTSVQDTKDQANRLRDLKKKILTARDSIKKKVFSSATEQRELWLTYSRALKQIREELPQKKEFGEYVKANGLDNFEGMDLDANMRTDAIEIASYPQQVIDYIAKVAPDAASPRQIKYRYTKLLKLAVEEVAENNPDLIGQLTRVPSDKAPRGVPMEQHVKEVQEFEESAEGVISDAQEQLKVLLENPETSAEQKKQIESIDGFLDVVDLRDFGTRLANYTPKEKPKKFADLTVDEAAEVIIKKLRHHDDPQGILERIYEMAEKTDIWAQDEDAPDTVDNEAEGEEDEDVEVSDAEGDEPETEEVTATA